MCNILQAQTNGRYDVSGCVRCFQMWMMQLKTEKGKKSDMSGWVDDKTKKQEK